MRELKRLLIGLIFAAVIAWSYVNVYMPALMAQVNALSPPAIKQPINIPAADPDNPPPVVMQGGGTYEQK